MQIDTGELRRMSPEVAALMAEEFRPVPKRLQAQANKALGNADSTFIDLASESDLARWAAEERAKRTDRERKIAAGRQNRKQRRKRKIAAMSRRVNRK